ncbi:MAG: urate hydroxylase PuuD [Myxococcaceae bacterium]|jgi:uncharacterized membrane protein|nr:urate hydroxylase PuuD [Myxococcaceae bacterium]
MTIVLEWLNLLVRWVHVIAAIMWIGDSFLFMWLDSHLTAPTKPRDGAVVGELWMTHSGGFYEVIKRKSLAQNELPAQLYWFKWESYTTWLSGFALLCVVYYGGNAAFLVDSSVSNLTAGQAVALSLGLLPTAFLVYELLWATPLSKDNRLFGLVGFGLLSALGFALTHLFSGRGAFLQMGATMATIMAANVFFRIIPSQRHMLAATKAGTPVDTSYGLRAKGRSVHNHYLTLPVLFTMLSNHFPSTYGHEQAWLVLSVLFLFGASLKYAMNFRGKTHPVVLTSLVGSLGGFVFLTMPKHEALPGLEAYAHAKPVSFATVDAIVQSRCVSCHAAKPGTAMFSGPPQGIMLETKEQIGLHAERIYLRAVATKTMPLGNLTGITQAERDLLGAWMAQGANVEAPGPVELPSTPTPPSPGPEANAQGKADTLFSTVCASCHGADGRAETETAKALSPHPRAYVDAEWQKSVTDEQLAKVIVEGGAAVGKSPLMPANPDLASQPEVVQALVKKVRSFAP